MSRLLSTLAVLIGLTTVAHAGETTIRTYSDTDEQYVVFEGSIDQGESERFLAVIEQLENPEGTVIYLYSGGGYIYEAEKMAQIIRDRGMKTALYKTDVCASACTLLFASGVERYMWEGAQLGFHPAAISDWPANASLQGIYETGQWSGVNQLKLYFTFIPLNMEFLKYYESVHKDVAASEMDWIDATGAYLYQFATRIIEDK